MSAVELLLSRLEGVRKRGPDQWSARCPAHEDKSPSLSVKELPDGRVLMHCFGGCAVADVLDSIQLSMLALFPKRAEPGGGTSAMHRRRLLPAGQALEQITAESRVVWVAAHNLAAGHALTDVDRHRLAAAAARIQALSVDVRA